MVKKKVEWVPEVPPTHGNWLWTKTIPRGPGWSNFRARTQTWFSTDSEERFREQKKPALGEDSVSYAFNHHGFRSDPFAFDEKCVIYVGCSTVAGIGIPVEQTWAHIVHKHIEQTTGEKLAYWNLGSPGVGNREIARLVYQFVSQAKPLLVVCSFTDLSRRVTYPQYNKTHNRGWWVDEWERETDADDWYEFVANFTLVNQTCALANVPWYWFMAWTKITENSRKTFLRDDNYLRAESAYPFLDFARDEVHYGVKTAANVAEQVIAGLNIQSPNWR
jgi:hypothetical protein